MKKAVFCFLCLIVIVSMMVSVASCGEQSEESKTVSISATEKAVDSSLDDVATSVVMYTESIEQTKIVTDKNSNTFISVVGTKIVKKAKSIIVKETTVDNNLSTTKKSNNQTVIKTSKASVVSKTDAIADSSVYTAQAILSGANAKISGNGITATGGKITISKAGAFYLKGNYSGQIVVNASKEDEVVLVLDGVTVNSSNGPAVLCDSVSSLVLKSLKGTENTFTDTEAYASDDYSACIHSDDDIVFDGEGTIKVNAKYAHGVFSKNDIVFIAGTVRINALIDGIKAVDRCIIKSGVVNINAHSDGVEITNNTEAEKGYFEMSGGTVSIVAGDDAIQAVSAITVIGGKLKIESGDKDYNCDGKVTIKSSCVV